MAAHPIRILLTMAGLAALTVVCWRGYDVFLGGNLDTIAAGQAYRSAQLSGPKFRETISTLNLRSVINLRGPNHKAEWYQDEIAACHEAGIEHYDLAMSSSALPTPETAVNLIQTLRAAPKPFLVHCKAGADRTGLATAVWLVLSQGVEPSRAAAEGLTLWHGHIPLIGPATAMDRFFQLYTESGRGRDFEQWVREKYPAEYARVSGSPMVAVDTLPNP